MTCIARRQAKGLSSVSKAAPDATYINTFEKRVCKAMKHGTYISTGRKLACCCALQYQSGHCNNRTIFYTIFTTQAEHVCKHSALEKWMRMLVLFNFSLFGLSKDTAHRTSRGPKYRRINSVNINITLYCCRLLFRTGHNTIRNVRVD